MSRFVRLLRGRQRTRRSSLNKETYDPMSHPDIMRMSLHQLADLPFTTPDGYRDKHCVAGGSGRDAPTGLR